MSAPRQIIRECTNLLAALKAEFRDGDTAIIDLDGTLCQASAWDASPAGYPHLCHMYGKFHGDAIWKSKIIDEDFEIQDRADIAKFLSTRNHFFLTDRSKMLEKPTEKFLADNGFISGNLVACQGHKVEWLARHAASNVTQRYVIADDSDTIIKKVVESIPAFSMRKILKFLPDPIPESYTNLRHYGKIIALSGKMGSGKDEATRILIEKIYKDKKCTIVRFADALKQLVSDLMVGKVYTEKTKSELVTLDCGLKNMTEAVAKFNAKVAETGARELKKLRVNALAFQFDGEEMSWSKWHARMGGFCREECGAEVFVKLAQLEMLEQAKKFDVVIVNDTRFKNEWEMLLRMGVPMIRLNRPTKMREASFNGRDPENVSETNLDDTPFEYCVENDSNEIGELESKLREIVEN